MIPGLGRHRCRQPEFAWSYLFGDVSVVAWTPGDTPVWLSIGNLQYIEVLTQGMAS